jgi:YVTN family beta-propeller protein
MKTIAVGNAPHSVAVNPNTDMIYVTNRDSNTVSVIDGKTNSVIKTVKVGVHPIDIGLNPNTGKVYIANEENDTVSIIN